MKCLIHLTPKFDGFCSSPLMVNFCTKKEVGFAKKKNIVCHHFQWKPSNWALLLLLLLISIAKMWKQCYALWMSSTFFLKKLQKLHFFVFSPRWYNKFAITMMGVFFHPKSKSCKYGFTFLWGESWRKHYLHVDSSNDGVESWEKAWGNVYCFVLLMSRWDMQILAKFCG